MASVVNESSGRRRIDYFGADGKRHKLRLGKIAARDADAIRYRVETIVDDQRQARLHSTDTLAWVARLDPLHRRRMERLGLLSASRTSEIRTLDQLLTAHDKTRDVKETTLASYRQTDASLREHFGASKVIIGIDGPAASAWRAGMKDKGLAEATIAIRVKRARTIFKMAAKWGLIASNPFLEVRTGNMSNPARLRFIDRATIDKVLAACPDNRWRLIVVLSRFGGLRCPSEHMALTWADVNFDARKMLVRSSKNERHHNAERWVPIFPEIMPHLLEAFHAAEPGTKFVIDAPRGRDVSIHNNFRTQFERILKRAGLTMWPRPFHNLRATRQTELVETVPLHLVCQWIGNSERVAAKHYLQVTDEHFRLATMTDAERVAHQQAQHTSAPGGTLGQSTVREVKNMQENQAGDAGGEIPEDYGRARTIAKIHGKPGRPDVSGAYDGAHESIPDEVRMRAALASIAAYAAARQGRAS